MRQSRLIGITGGIGTGKSLVSQYLIKKGYTVIDFDLISKEIYVKGKEAYKEIVCAFGESIKTENGEIDRTKLADIVFQNKDKLLVLNQITHKFIFEEAKKLIKEHSGSETLFLDIPLLFEVREEMEKSGIKIEEVWFIYSDRELQIERVMKRDNIDYHAALKRIESQIPTKEKLKYADKIICNLGEKTEVYNQIDMLLSLI